MPYFLNDPASMATNSGACSKDMAGTDTLIVFSGVSAEKVGASGDTNKAAREIKIVHRVIVQSIVPNSVTTRLSQAQENVQLGFLKLSRCFFSDAKTSNCMRC